MLQLLMLHYFSSVAVVLTTIAAGFTATFDLSKNIFESKVRLIRLADLMNLTLNSLIQIQSVVDSAISKNFTRTLNTHHPS